MRQMKRVLALLLITLLVLGMTACGSKKAMEPFLGSWKVYQMGSESGITDFTTGLFSIMELTIEIREDGTYTMHYFVAGEEGDQYPKHGEFEMEKGKIIIPGDPDGIGEIVDGDLVLAFGDNNTHYYRRVD